MVWILGGLLIVTGCLAVSVFYLTRALLAANAQFARAAKEHADTLASLAGDWSAQAMSVSDDYRAMRTADTAAEPVKRRTVAAKKAEEEEDAIANFRPMGITA